MTETFQNQLLKTNTLTGISTVNLNRIKIIIIHPYLWGRYQSLWPMLSWNSPDSGICAERTRWFVFWSVGDVCLKERSLLGSKRIWTLSKEHAMFFGQMNEPPELRCGCCLDPTHHKVFPWVAEEQNITILTDIFKLPAGWFGSICPLRTHAKPLVTNPTLYDNGLITKKGSASTKKDLLLYIQAIILPSGWSGAETEQTRCA